MKQFVFSIDIEDWFQVENLKNVVFYKDWANADLRICESTNTVLEMLGMHNVKATFFILGWIAERVPGLVKRIADNGHEIASHGYKHELLHTIDDTKVELDIKKSLKILKPLAHNRIVGYRAPSFSITKTAARSLKAMNFKYDASLNDFQFNKRYGRIAVSKKIGKVNHHNCTYAVLENGLIEFPISVNTYLRVYWPLGGGYFRLSPMWFLKKQLCDIYKTNDIACVYLHPWEFDPAQPRVEGLSVSYYVRHYYGLGKTAGKFESLIGLVKSIPDIEIRTFGEMAKKFTNVD